MRSYDIMIATARREPEGSLIYILDKADLYLRVRDGLRQVLLGEYRTFFGDLGNEVAEVQPPPVVVYPRPPDRTVNNGAGDYSQGSAVIRPVEPPLLQQPSPPLAAAESSESGLHLVALNAPQTGNMRGIRGADFQCFQEARAVGLKGTFRAFLSSKLQDLYTIVRRSDRNGLPIVNLKNQVLFSSWESIFSEQSSKMRENVPLYSFDGRDILRDSAWPEKMVWHGSSEKGHRQMDHYCETWRAGERAVMGLASSLQSGRLLQQTPSSCSGSYVVLCIENAFTSPSK